MALLQTRSGLDDLTNKLYSVALHSFLSSRNKKIFYKNIIETEICQMLRLNILIKNKPKAGILKRNISLCVENL